MPPGLDILGFGASAIDEILYVDGPLGAGKGKVVSRDADFGGNIATALVAAAKLGGHAGFIGWLGDQPASLSAARELERHGVDISHAPRRPDSLPVRSTILVGPDGERFIAYDDDGPHGTSEALPDEVIAQARVLLIDGYAVQSVAVVSRARALGLAVVADIEWSAGSATTRLVELADHLVLPVASARALTGEHEEEAMLRSLWSDSRAAVVLTHGQHGVYLRQRGDEVSWHVPAHAVTAVDTTGAGDCFHGAYALGLVEGKSPLECVVFASAVAAISVTGHGGRRALPDRAACLAWMAGREPLRPVVLAL